MTSTRAIGSIAMPNVVGQPKCSASLGAKSVASSVPELPAPAMPIASPWYSGGYQRLASGSATAKLAPAMPRKNPST